MLEKYFIKCTEEVVDEMEILKMYRREICINVMNWRSLFKIENIGESFGMRN